MVANDLCIKAKNRCGSVKQSSFQWFGVFRAIAGSLLLSSFIIKDDTTVKLFFFETPKKRYDTL